MVLAIVRWGDKLVLYSLLLFGRLADFGVDVNQPLFIGSSSSPLWSAVRVHILAYGGGPSTCIPQARGLRDVICQEQRFYLLIHGVFLFTCFTFLRVFLFRLSALVQQGLSAR